MNEYVRSAYAVHTASQASVHVRSHNPSNHADGSDIADMAQSYDWGHIRVTEPLGSEKQRKGRFQ